MLKCSRSATAVVVAALVAVPVAGAEPAALRRTVYAMGTELELEVEGRPAEALRAATETALGEVRRIEAACSTWRSDSAWSHLNHAHGAAVHLDAEWLELLATALKWSRDTDGAFDPVLGALLTAWGTRSGGRVPSGAELATARAASGAALLTIDRVAGTVRLRHADAGLDEGGFLKGYALDRMASALRQRGVTSGLLDFGGQLLAFGRPRPVGLASPGDRHRPRAEVVLAEGSLSTSGTSERGRHLIDPVTGDRASAWGSVSVLAADGLTADILSTALYVMGPKRGLAWANAHHVAAFFQPLGHRPLVSDRFPALSPPAASFTRSPP